MSSQRKRLSSTCCAILLMLATLSAGCSPGTAVPPQDAPWAAPQVYLTGQVRHLRILTDSRPLAYVGSLPVVGLAQLVEIPTNQGKVSIVLWGSRKPSNGLIDRVTEAQVFGMGSPAGSVHVFFDTAMQPSLFRDDASGYSIALRHESASTQRVTLCDPAFTALAQTTVARTAQGPQVAAVTSGGSCTIANADARPALERSTRACTYPSVCHLGRIITAGSYIASLASSVGAIMKYRQHKDHPGNAGLGTPIALVVIAAALLYLPGVFRIVGKPTHGSDPIAQSGIPPVYVAQRSLPGCGTSAPSGTCPFPHPEPTPSPSANAFTPLDRSAIAP